MSFWILFCSCCLLLMSLQLALSGSSNSARPLILALPIRIHGNQMPYPMAAEDKEREEDSDEEQQREQRLVPRTYNPNAEARYPRQQEENSNTNSQSNFLTWNPGNKFMVLQINDFISFKQEDSNESEENERPEERVPVKPGQNWSYQGGYDFEDSGRIPSSKGKEEQKGFRPSQQAPKRKKTVKNYSMEDIESDVYGTDPVIHYLRNKHKRNETHFDFGEMSDDTGDEFNFKDWWSYKR